MLASITRACAQRGYDLLISFQQPNNEDWQAGFADSNKAAGIRMSAGWKRSRAWPKCAASNTRRPGRGSICCWKLSQPAARRPSRTDITETPEAGLLTEGRPLVFFGGGSVDEKSSSQTLRKVTRPTGHHPDRFGGQERVRSGNETRLLRDCSEADCSGTDREIDPQGLNLRGTPQHPFLSGSLSILNSDLEYPPTTSSDRARGQTLNYVVVGDTTRETGDHPGPRQ